MRVRVRVRVGVGVGVRVRVRVRREFFSLAKKVSGVSEGGRRTKGACR